MYEGDHEKKIQDYSDCLFQGIKNIKQSPTKSTEDEQIINL